MLILTRRVGETVMIGNEVTFTILGVKGNQVRIGINAPKNVPVHREEIYKRIKRELSGGEVNGNVQEPAPPLRRMADHMYEYARAEPPAPKISIKQRIADEVAAAQTPVEQADSGTGRKTLRLVKK